MSPKSLSQWADESGIPRRTAYNWAKSGKLNVPLHRTLTGRLMVLDDDAGDELEAHPFVAAYAESLRVPVRDRVADLDHSSVLEAWGNSLYDAVADELRPVVLQLAVAAACRRPKDDVPARFSDWIGRIELADWHEATGLPEAAERIRARGEITDAETYRKHWPGSPNWDTDFDEDVRRALQERDLAQRDGGGAADYLAENGLIGLDNLQIAGRRENLRAAIDKITTTEEPGFPLPDRGELWDLRAMYAEPMWAIARPITRQTAWMICDLIGWAPESATPPPGHPLHEVGFSACTHAAYAALIPQQHAAHVREIDAFRRIALGQPHRLAST